jgi:hypothetical protein
MHVEVKIQPIEHLEEVIEEIRESMLKSTKYVVSKEKLNRGVSARVAGMQQKQQRRGAGGQLQEKVWDPGGFQQSWEAHEKELMNFHSNRV